VDAEWPRPLDGRTTPRFVSARGLFRLPFRESAAGLDVALLGLPFDGAVTNRPGARHGPAAVRAASQLIRGYNPATGADPFRVARVADLGDVNATPLDLAAALEAIATRVAEAASAGARVMTVGGDHLTTLPVLRGLKRAGALAAPLGLVHFDAHSDTADANFGSPLGHGTPFRRAIEEGLIDPARTVQIGIRGSGYGPDDLAWTTAAGVRVIPIEECETLGPAGVVAEARRVAGGLPCWLSFDVDCLDPAFAPGTGTPEWGGLTPREALAMLRGLAGLDLVGGDLVEVAPAYDHAEITAIAGATVLFEMLCLVAAPRGR
jgi:guanidinopropionase